MSLATLILLVRTVSYTSPAFLADTAYYTNPSWDGTSSPLFNSCAAGAVPELNPLTIKLYGAKAYQGTGWARIFLRSHTVLPGIRDTFNLYDDEPWSYWVVPSNAAGEGCEAGITVGVANVGVPLTGGAPKRVLFDLAGRRVEGVPRSGVYFEMAPGTKTKRIVVIR